MSKDELTRIRKIGHTGITTPLIVPSYSSRGFNPVGSLFDLFSRYTTSCCLISSYDLHYTLLPMSALYSSDVVVLDSGGYEAYASSELSTPLKWSIEDYMSVLTELDERANVVPVTFDFGNQIPVKDQLKSADDIINRLRPLPWDMLIKPSTPSAPHVNTTELISNLPSMPAIAMLGFVESELGSSIIQRGRNIKRIRLKLIEMGLDIPIHIFGCLDPNLIPYYVLAGADVFDGLQWLRHVLTSHGAIRFSSMAIKERQWHQEDSLLISSYRVQNLHQLNRLRRSLIDYITSHDCSGLSAMSVEESDLAMFVGALEKEE